MIGLLHENINKNASKYLLYKIKYQIFENI